MIGHMCVAIFFGLASSPVATAPGPAKTITAVQDAEIHRNSPTVNYGALTAVQVRYDTDPSKGYVQFDASGQGVVCGIKSFKMFSTYEYGRSASFYLIKGSGADSWDEDTLTWNNAPGNDANSADGFLNDGACTNIYLGINESVSQNTTAWFLWDSEEAKDALVHELNTGDRKATIAFCRNGDRLVKVASTENGTNAMRMDLWMMPDSRILSAIKDAEIKKNAPTTNYGSAITVKAQRDTDPSKGYVQFSASGCGVITNISSLSMVSTHQYGRAATFYLISGSNADNWLENQITWSNAPGNDTASDTAFLNSAAYTSLSIGHNEAVTQNTPSELIWDSQSAKDAVISALNTGDRKITIAFCRTGDRQVNIASKESTLGAMLLNVQEQLFPAVVDAVKDATVSMADPVENYGSASTVKAQRDIDPSKGYIQFDASGLNLVTDIESLNMVSTCPYPRSAKFYLITGSNADNWAENAISWDTAPANNTFSETEFLNNSGHTSLLIGQNEAVAQNTRAQLMWEGGGKDALLTELNTGDRKATIAFSRTGDSQVNIASREHSIYAPVQMKLQTAYCPSADTTISDAEFFEILSTDYPGLSTAISAYNSGNVAAAKHLLCDYYRNRGTNFWWSRIYKAPDENEGQTALAAYSNLVNKTGSFAPELWRADGTFNWHKVDSITQRMYFFSSLGRAYQYSGNEEIAQAWIGLFRSWIDQMPREDPAKSWVTMNLGICLRSGWGDAFNSFLHSPLMNDENLFLFMKAFYEQALFLRENHSETSNWLTFEMAGLYSAAVLFPEWRESSEWRSYVVQVVTNDLDKGWLPDGVTVELTPGYGQFFSNYLLISDLAKETGYAAGAVTNIVAKTEDLYTTYLKMMAPGWVTPAFNDNVAVNVAAFMQSATNRFPERQDFIWAASKGAHGTKPDYLSVVFPYAGYLAIRSSWATNANYLCFDAGPVGYRHAHQDKLGLVLWAYGRQILYDPGRQAYDDTNPYQQYCMDTFSHSTGLVDNRPQRRNWYSNPNPVNWPYTAAETFWYSISNSAVWASGIYSNSYGLPGGSVSNDAYPYMDNSNFFDGWGTPASHRRQVAYVHPDIFVVQDWFIPNDSSTHSYEIRWQLDSLSISTNGTRAETSDSGKPNLAVIPLRSSGLSVSWVSAVDSPDIMGWKVLETMYPATTLRHIKSGTGNQGFITLLFPLEPGGSASGISSSEGGGVITLNTGDGRIFKITPAATPAAALTVEGVVRQ